MSKSVDSSIIQQSISRYIGPPSRNIPYSRSTSICC